VWSSKVRDANSVTRVAAKLELLRRVHKKWATGLSKFKK
jgi:hypothetical protein